MTRPARTRATRHRHGDRARTASDDEIGAADDRLHAFERRVHVLEQSCDRG